MSSLPSSQLQFGGSTASRSRFFWTAVALIAFLLEAPSANSAQKRDSPAPIAWVQVLPGGPAVRAITTAVRCPDLEFNARPSPMTERASPDADFQIRTCEAPIPAGTKRVTLAGKLLRLPPEHPRRITVVGDTGCRMKLGNGLDYGFQACNLPAKWPFAKVATQIAAWKPDLIIHLGDYVYREQPCPADNKGCAGSPITGPGQRWATWQIEWFKPAAPILAAAPLLLIRGDHEDCSRAGPGWFRFFDPRPWQQCDDTTEPYAIDFDGLRLVIMDTVLAADTTLAPENVRQLYTKQFDRARELSRGRTWLLGHRPLWGVRPTDEAGLNVELINVTLQNALSHASGLSPEIELILTGHIHLGQMISFKGGRPPQMVAGTGGTMMLPSISAKLVGTQIDGAIVEDMAVVSRHGFFTFEPESSAWRVTFQDVDGITRARCTFRNKSFACRQ